MSNSSQSSLINAWTLKQIWSAGLKIGYNPSISGLERGRIMMLNGVLIAVSFSVIIFSIAYFIIDYRYFYGPLYIIPVAITVLALNSRRKYTAARNFYLFGSMLVILFWCYEGRGNGNEYTLIGLATTSTMIFQRKSAIYLINFVCAGIFITYKLYDSYLPFIPDPVINYRLIPWIILITSVAILSFQIAFFRDLVHRSDKKLFTKYEELNIALEQQRKIKEELTASNEALKISNERLQQLTLRQEAMYKQKDTELQSYIDAINVSLYSSITDLDGLFVMVNSPLLAASGYSREELVGKHYSLLATQQHQSIHSQRRIEILLAGKTWRGEVEHQSKDKRSYWFDCVVIPIKDEQNQIKFFLSLGLPITERKTNEMIREKTQRILETIAFRTSHKIRGPLARIEGLTNLIQRDLIVREEFKSIAGSIALCSEELKMATSEMVEFVNDHRELIKVIH